MSIRESFSKIDRYHRSELKVIPQQPISGRTKILISDSLVAAPHPARNLAVDSFGETTVDLTWDAPVMGGADSYTVYAYNNTSGALEQTITGIILTEAQVMGLTQDNEYEFWVIAVRDGIDSVESNHVTATPEDVIAPSAPTGLVEDSVTTDSIAISWNANAEPDLVGYNVYVDGVKVNVAIVEMVNYTIQNLIEETTYNINITAVDDSGNESAFSDTLVSTTAAPEPDGLAPGWYDKTSVQDVYILNDVPVPARLGTGVWDAARSRYLLPGIFNGSSYENQMRIFDPVTGGWNTQALNVGMNAGAGCFIKGDYLFYGPRQADNGDVYTLNLVNGTQAKVVDSANGTVAPHRQGCLGYDPVNDHMYILGDQDQVTHSRKLDIFDVSDPLNVTFLRQQIVPNIAGHYPGIIECAAGKCYIFDGNGNGKMVSYDYASDSFTELAICPTTIGRAYMFEHEGNILLCMFLDNNTYVYLYDVAGNSYTEITNTSPYLYRQPVPAFNPEANELWCFGGYDDATASTKPEVQLLVL